MLEFMEDYATAFYKGLDVVVTILHDSLPIAVTVGAIIFIISFTIGLASFIYEEIKKQTQRKGKNG